MLLAHKSCEFTNKGYFVKKKTQVRYIVKNIFKEIPKLPLPPRIRKKAQFTIDQEEAR